MSNIQSLPMFGTCTLTDFRRSEECLHRANRINRSTVSYMVYLKYII